VIVEGELDALLVAQELAGFECSVVTLGSASARIDSSALSVLTPASPWIVATDADDAGDRFAAVLEEIAPARVRRVRPSEKDWTDTHRGGVNRVRYHLSGLLKTPATAQAEDQPCACEPTS
jgi:DNA primase